MNSPPGTGGEARRAGVVDQLLWSHPMKRFIYNSKTLEPNRKELRNALTSAEAFLWTQLKKRQLSGKKFRRQYSVGPYTLDFFLSGGATGGGAGRRASLHLHWTGA